MEDPFHEKDIHRIDATKTFFAVREELLWQ